MRLLVFFKRIAQDLKKYTAYLLYSSKCMLKSEVSGSILNWLWWILDPFFYMLVYAFLSVVIFKAKQQYFQIYIIIGVITWNLFNKQIVTSTNAVKSNISVLSKCYIPKYIFLLQNLLVALFKFVIAFGLVLIMMVIWRVPFTWRIAYIFPYLLLLTIISFGLSTFVMHASVYIRDMVNIVPVIMRILFYVSGIFYSIKDNVPYPFNRIISYMNPAYVVIDGIREAVLYGRQPDVITLIAWLLISVMLSLAGIALIYRYENDYVKVTQ